MRSDADRREKKSPLKQHALPAPGESLARARDEVVMDKALLWSVLAGVALGIALQEWWRWIWDAKPHPVTVTAIALGFGLLAFWRIAKLRPRLQQMNLGIEGEKFVGQGIERLRERGYEVFHDIPGDGFNVDHVLVGPGGLFTIETKTVSKPARGSSEIAYDGEHVTVDGLAPDRDPIAQAKASASQIRRILSGFGQDRAPIRPVVLYPGWFVQKKPKGAEVWVLNENVLPQFIAYEGNNLSNDQVRLIAAGIANYSRSHRE